VIDHHQPPREIQDTTWFDDGNQENHLSYCEFVVNLRIRVVAQK